MRSIALMLFAVVFAARAAAGEDALPRELHDAMVLQLALDEAGFSPGLIDGKPGPKTMLALREYQKSRGLRATAHLDAPTTAALRLADRPVLATYRITQQDVASVTGAAEGWLERSRMKSLGYISLTDALAERFHCSQAMLRQLNPDIDIDAAAAGRTLTVPAAKDAPTPAADHLEVNLAEKTVRVFDSNDRVVALMHCSIAADKTKAPRGRCSVAVVVENPNYTFDPAKWPEVRGIDRKLLIPPGPRNPVGVFWVGLSLDGYGIHGTPWPEMIGKTGSHGCIRLTNWDARRLGKMSRPGMTVKFTASGSSAVAGAPG